MLNYPPEEAKLRKTDQKQEIPMSILENHASFIIRQKKEWGEILTGIETKNRYQILDAKGGELFFAYEEKSNWFIRQLLKTARPFTVNVLDASSSTVIRAVRPFRWIFPEITVTDAQGAVIGCVEKRFTLLRRLYVATDPNGMEIFRLFGPILKPWTFHIIENGKEVGCITKKWSGAMKEAFTSADNFGAEFPLSWSDGKKFTALGAVFLIDIVHFEMKN